MLVKVNDTTENARASALQGTAEPPKLARLCRYAPTFKDDKPVLLATMIFFLSRSPCWLQGPVLDRFLNQNRGHFDS